METMDPLEKIAEKNTEWNLSPLFASDNDPRMEEDQRRVKERIEAFAAEWERRTDHLTDPAVLADALDEYERLMRDCGTSGDIGFYAGLRSAQDQSDPNIKALDKKATDFSVAMYNRIQFFELRVARIEKNDQAAFLEHPRLAPYRHFLEHLFKTAEYLLSEPEERILNLKALPASELWKQMRAEFLSTAEREVLLEDGTRAVKPFEEILSLVDSTVKPVRDGAAQAVNSILGENLRVAEAELNAVLANKKIDDELRGLPRPDASRHASDDIETETVDALIAGVKNRFDVSQRYYALKAKLLGVERLAYHERNVPYGSLDAEYSYADAVGLVHRVMRNLDGEFGDMFERFVREGRIDAFPRKGKNGGAFCAAGNITHPVYILLNHSGKLRDVTTLAHEYGHGANDELMKREQNALTFGASLATAEVASTFMEDFVLEELGKEADDERRLALLMMRLNDDVSTIFRQISCYRFEQELHAAYREAGHLPKEAIGALFQKHMAAYMGDAVEQTPGAENWWVYWGHIRRFFYNYSYASGLMISKVMQAKTREDPQFVSSVKEFFSAGSSDSPQRLFSRMGIDIADPGFWEQGIAEVSKMLDEAESLARSLGKI